MTLPIIQTIMLILAVTSGYLYRNSVDPEPNWWLYSVAEVVFYVALLRSFWYGQ